MATKTVKAKHQNNKGRIERVVEAAADAAQELGAAATSFKQSLRHVHAARGKVRPAATAIKRVASRATSATKKGGQIGHAQASHDQSQGNHPPQISETLMV